MIAAFPEAVSTMGAEEHFNLRYQAISLFEDSGRFGSTCPSPWPVVYIFLLTEQPLKSLFCQKEGAASVTLPHLRSRRSVADNQREYSNHLK
jgi:hypothetical protein